MRIDRSALFSRSALVALGMALSAWLLSACPGTLDDKQRFARDAGNTTGGRDGGEDSAAPAEAGSETDVEADAGPDTGACGDVITRIFVPSCGGTGCHGAVGPQQGLDLVSPGVAGRVVGIAGVGCASLLADPANPEASLIYRKLSPTPPCGSPMPLSRPALSDEDEACVLTWIAAQ